MTEDTGEHFLQWPVVNTLFQGKMDHHKKED